MDFKKGKKKKKNGVVVWKNAKVESNKIIYTTILDFCFSKVQKEMSFLPHSVYLLNTLVSS